MSMKPVPPRPDLDELLKQSIAQFEAMTPEQKAVMHQAQAESWARSCITNPEDRHGVYGRAELNETALNYAREVWGSSWTNNELVHLTEFVRLAAFAAATTNHKDHDHESR